MQTTITSPAVRVLAQRMAQTLVDASDRLSVTPNFNEAKYHALDASRNACIAKATAIMSSVPADVDATAWVHLVADNKQRIIAERRRLAYKRKMMRLASL